MDTLMNHSWEDDFFDKIKQKRDQIPDTIFEANPDWLYKNRSGDIFKFISFQEVFGSNNSLGKFKNLTTGEEVLLTPKYFVDNFKRVSVKDILK